MAFLEDYFKETCIINYTFYSVRIEKHNLFAFKIIKYLGFLIMCYIFVVVAFT